MSQRTGPFWDGVAGLAPMPPAARTLGLQFVDIDPDAGTVELAFEARTEWTNPAGNVLGAFVAAMLYDTVGPALLATLKSDQFQSTHDISVHFLRPVRPSRLTAKGRVVHRDGDLAHLAASLFGPDSEVVATATAITSVIPLDRIAGAV